MNASPVAPAANLVIFGVLGDLASRLLMPAMASLAGSGLLAPGTRLLGVSHHDLDDDGLRCRLDELVGPIPGWSRIREHVHYQKGEFSDPQLFATLVSELKGNAIFYLATAPQFFGPIIDSLGKGGLLDEIGGFRRVVIEKPFGTDLASAQALNRQILARAREEQIYRIDHFLGKETVRNIMLLRFANTVFEAIWNSCYIDHVQITVAETLTVGSRGKFYDETGALRDMVPNHLFQLLAMIGMEPPISLDAEAVRDEKARVISAIRPVDPDQAARGRYGSGDVLGQPVSPYLAEINVNPASRTETFVALEVHVDTPRWSGVPFFLRTGKALAARDTEILIQFRDVPHSLSRQTGISANRLVLQLQPDEGISLDLMMKRPGPALELAPVSMNLNYADHFKLGSRTGYETLLYDVLTGDQTLFPRADQIEAGWRALQPLIERWDHGWPQEYAAGSAGPASADALIRRAGRNWHPVG